MTNFCLKQYVQCIKSTEGFGDKSYASFLYNIHGVGYVRVFHVRSVPCAIVHMGRIKF
jgi:hypothetical protein